MYRADREPYYRHLLTLYSKYIPQDMIIGWQNGKQIMIDTDSKDIFELRKDKLYKIGQFRH
jgi:hypothetical protein